MMRVLRRLFIPVSLLFIAVLLTVLVGIHNHHPRTPSDDTIDNTIYTTAQTIAAQLNTSIKANNYIPQNLPADSNLPNRSAITYAKLNYTSYLFCINYRTGDARQNTTSGSTQLEIPSKHTQGQNCQTIHPYVDPIQQSGSLYVCDMLVNQQYGVGYESSGNIDAIWSNFQDEPVLQIEKPNGTQSGPFTVFPADQIFNSQCQSITSAQLRIGQPLYIFNADNGHQVFLQAPLSWH